MADDDIVIRGAREHNLRDVGLNLPRNALICLTGVSGSGKSSLAFDTLFAEGQRRYIESLSSYARQFLGQLPKPDVDRIDGLCPAIAIQQKTAGRNPRSTVGTITEIHDYLRVLFARVGQGHCPNCGRPITAQTRDQIVGRAMELPAGTAFAILAPVIRGQKGEHKDLFAELGRAGFVRARVNGQVVSLSDDLALERNVKHNIEVVIDRLKAGPSVRARVADAIELALKHGEGTAIIAPEGQPDILLSSQYACAPCGLSFEPPSPQLFSFNSPQGMCPDCDGLGTKHTFDPALLIPDPSRSVAGGALVPIGTLKGMGKWRRHLIEGVAANLEGDPDAPAKVSMLNAPWADLPDEWKEAWLYGTGDRRLVFRWNQKGKSWSHADTWSGFIPDLLEKYQGGGQAVAALEPFMKNGTCAKCGGSRLNPRARSVRVGGKSIAELGQMPVSGLKRFFDALAGAPPKDLAKDEAPSPALSGLSMTIAEELFKEIRGRLQFLLNVGLDYLTLDRSAPTLSGGEAQRIRLASQVGAGLVGVLYILDEPSIGLHPRDNDRLLGTLQALRDQGNTVVVVEHDEDTMRAADYLVDFGPGPGVKGGEVVVEGSYAKVAKDKASLTGQYLSGRRKIEVPGERKAPSDKWLTVANARQNNLKGVDVKFPLGLFVAVTGVSGSGKSSLIGEILRDTLARDLNGAETEPGAHDEIRGIEHLDKLIDIDQSAIGRTPRSNPATYIKLFDQIRDLYAKLPDAKARGYQPGRFSFNVEGGRCEACQGNGSNRLEMDFLADVWVTCPVCQGHRFNRETLHVRYKGKSIADVLEMDIQDALEHFANIPKIARMLQTLHDVGLDYLKLGQPSPTLSGGEAQRIKLARELVKKGTGKTVYVLDEPTTGLHFEDVRRLLDVLHRFTRDGNTVIVIEHNLDVVKTADWVIDLGPEGGSGGGLVIAEGTPEQVAKVAASHTGKALKPFLDPKPAKVKSASAKKKARTAPPELQSILIRGASQHNLKGVDLDIPRGAMSVCSGPSGSGKSSLAIDTLYAEGQRRYVESLSSYARQFLSPLQKPKVEQIRGLSPAISIEQKTTSKSPRSTVGTVTEIHDYLRVLFARLGQPHCPKCATPIGTQTADEIVEKILHLPEGTRVNIMAPVERRDGQSYEELWEDLRSSGFARVRVDQVSHNLESPPKLSSQRKHKVEVVVDRAIVRRSTRSRLADSVESALDLGQGVISVAQVGEGTDESKWPVQRFSQHRSCDTCGRSFDELTPHHFSFNSAIGWCPVCQGLGVQQGANPAVLIPDERKSLRQGAVVGWPDPEANPLFDRMLRALPIDSEVPFSRMDPLQQRLLLHGSESWFAVPPAKDQPGFSFQFKGLFPAVEEAARVSFFYRWKLQNLVDEVPCSTCAGGRLRDDAAAVKFRGHTIDEICRWPLGQMLKFFQALKLDEDGKHIAGDLIREIRERARFLVDVGLDYLSLSRGTPTLSGGESQRIRLASQIGSGLTGVLYVLDEPTIGLHPRDNGRLLAALQRLRDLGNTLVIVEHDREVIDSADALFDFGPGSGDAGGEITARGTPAAVRKSKASLTGQYLSGSKAIPVPTNRRPVPPEVAAITRGEKLNGKRKGLPALIVRGARHHNLRDLDVAFPLGVVTAVTGVSGSGKSSLVEDVLWKAAAKAIHRAKLTPGAHDKIENLSQVDKVIAVDQSPIGTTPASNPATYAGAFDLIRELYAKLPAAKVRGYTARRFSFNQVGGRCEACEGVGQKKIEMHFLPDVWVPCEHCGGTRYTSETLEVKFRGKSIADVLDMTVDGALELFAEVPKLAKVMRTLSDVGLGYVRLGQSAITLSGGEAQRVKLAAELARPDTGKTLYILDEPTTGLHMDDVRKLLDVIHRLADLGNTVVVIEHNLDVIKTADWLIDIGPDAGLEGGAVVGCGTPEQIAKIKGSHTGKVLKPVLEAGPAAERAVYDPKDAAKRDRKRTTAKELMQDAKPPWEVDGRRWHTVDRVGRTGRKPRWDGNALASVIDLVESIAGLPEAEWGERTVVKVGEFLKAMTSHEWVLTLKFRVPKGLFTTQGVAKRLDLVPFAEAAPPVLCDLPRVSSEQVSPTTQEITVLIHTLADVEQPQFEAFVREAAEAFRKGEGGSSELAKARESLAKLIAKSREAKGKGRSKAAK